MSEYSCRNVRIKRGFSRLIPSTIRSGSGRTLIPPCPSVWRQSSVDSWLAAASTVIEVTGKVRKGELIACPPDVRQSTKQVVHSTSPGRLPRRRSRNVHRCPCTIDTLDHV